MFGSSRVFGCPRETRQGDKVASRLSIWSIGRSVRGHAAKLSEATARLHRSHKHGRIIQSVIRKQQPLQKPPQARLRALCIEINVVTRWSSCTYVEQSVVIAPLQTGPGAIDRLYAVLCMPMKMVPVYAPDMQRSDPCMQVRPTAGGGSDDRVANTFGVNVCIGVKAKTPKFTG